MHRTLYFGSTPIPYTVTESAMRKTVNLSVEQGSVSVLIPKDTEKDIYEGILRKKAPWILKQLEDYKAIKERGRDLQFRSGEKLPYLGRYYRLRVISSACVTPSLRFLNGRFEAIVPEGSSIEDQREQLYPLYSKWVQERGQQFIEKRIPRFTQKLGQAPTEVVVRKMEKRWGSCTPQHKILLNWHIFLAPVTIIDYVIAHELAHLKEMNHTHAYWETLRMLVPDYEERKEWLRINGNQLYI